LQKLKSVYLPFLKLYNETVEIRRINLQRFKDVFFKAMCTFRAPDNDPQICLPREIKAVIQLTTDEIESFKDSLEKLKEGRKAISLKPLLEESEMLARDVRSLMYPASGSNYYSMYVAGQSNPLQLLKSDIRSLKGMLLSRRNF
jgi:hypothetical protein